MQLFLKSLKNGFKLFDLNTHDMINVITTIEPTVSDHKLVYDMIELKDFGNDILRKANYNKIINPNVLIATQLIIVT